MASIDDAIFLMDDDVICNNSNTSNTSNTSNKVKPMKHTKLRKWTLPIIPICDITDEKKGLIKLEKSPPMDIIRPCINKCKNNTDFIPSSPYIVSDKKGFSAPAIL